MFKLPKNITVSSTPRALTDADFKHIDALIAEWRKQNPEIVALWEKLAKDGRTPTGRKETQPRPNFKVLAVDEAHLILKESKP